MSGGFNNPIVGGGGALVYPSIHSPDFVHLVAGWSINKDGTAEFTGLVVTGGTLTSVGPLGAGFAQVQIQDGQVTFGAGNSSGGPFFTDAQIGLVRLQAGPTGETILQVSGGFIIDNGASGGIVYLEPSGDATGALDAAQIQLFLTLGYTVALLPGTFTVKSTLSMGGNQGIQGAPGTILQPAAALGSGMINVSGTNNYVAGIHFKGNSHNADAVQVAAGANRWTVRDIIAESVQGLVVNIPGSTGANHGVISGVLATGCNGGIAAVFGSGSSTLELSIAQCNIQSCQSAPVLVINGVTDIAVDDLNGAVITGSAVPAVQVIGSAQAVFMNKVDVGGDSTASGTTAVLDIGSTGSPSEITISDSVFQSGGNGIVIAGSAARLRFSSVMSKHNQFDGWKWTGTGAFNQMMMCAGNTNNQAAGTAYDVDVTSTAHVFIDAFAGVSGAVTANINITQVGNHVTVVNAPSTNTFAGQPQAGW